MNASTAINKYLQLEDLLKRSSKVSEKVSSAIREAEEELFAELTKAVTEGKTAIKDILWCAKFATAEAVKDK